MRKKKLCEYCGNPVTESMKFCGHCGRTIIRMEKADTNELIILSEGITKGDETAFKKFYELTNRKAYSIAYHMVKNEDETFDILQDAYIKAYKKINSLEASDKLESWFNMIVANTCRDYLKKKKPVLFNEMDTEEFEFEDTLENENQEFIPDATVDYKETKRLMMEILDNLSPEQKMCVLLYYYDELSVKEISEVLECSENTVKSRLNYARKKIKEDVLELEKKGTKLYGIAPIPFIVWILKGGEEVYGSTTAGTLYAEIIAKTKIASTTKLMPGVEDTTVMNATSTVSAKTITTTASIVAGKSIVSKVVICAIVAALAIGGITFIMNRDDANDSESVNKTTEEHVIEESVEAPFEEFEEKYLEGMLVYAPLFDEEKPLTEKDFSDFMKNILLLKYLYCWNETEFIDSDIPNPLANDEVRMSEKKVSYGTWPSISCSLDTFKNLARMLNYDGDVGEDFLINAYGFSNERFVIEDGNVVLLLEGLGGSLPEYELKILDKNYSENMLIVDYMLDEHDLYNNNVTSYHRSMTVELNESGYVIKKIGESDVYLNPDLSDFSEFGQAVLSQDKNVYQLYIRHAEELLASDLKEEKENYGIDYSYEPEFEKMFYVEDPSTSSDHAKFLNVVFRIERYDPEMDVSEIIYKRIEYYNEQHNGGWDAIISQGIQIDEKGILKEPISDSPSDVMVYSCESDYLNEIKETVEDRFDCEAAGPYVIDVK